MSNNELGRSTDCKNKNKNNIVDSTDSDEDLDNDDDDENDDDEDNENEEIKANNNKAKGVRNFFKNLISFASKSKKNSLETKKKAENFNIITNIVIVEKTDLNHRFLTVKNKNADLFSDYRISQSIKTIEEFRLNFFKFLPIEVKLIFFL